MKRTAAIIPITLVALLALVACSDDPLAPFQPEISNQPDTFQLQATGVTGRTASLSYSWSNSGAQATVNHSTTTSAGSARLIVKDGAGVIVYNELLVPSLNEDTLAGTGGTWTVQLVLDDYSGTLNFRIQKTT